MRNYNTRILILQNNLRHVRHARLAVIRIANWLEFWQSYLAKSLFLMSLNMILCEMFSLFTKKSVYLIVQNRFVLSHQCFVFTMQAVNELCRFSYNILRQLVCLLLFHQQHLFYNKKYGQIIFLGDFKAQICKLRKQQLYSPQISCIPLYH